MGVFTHCPAVGRGFITLENTVLARGFLEKGGDLSAHSGSRCGASSPLDELR